MFCKEKFDRNKFPFIITNPDSTSPRYIHASCAEGYIKKTKRPLGKPINPAEESICEYCHKAILRSEEVALPGDRFAHQKCHNIPKEKTDIEKLYDYIKEIYNESFVDPAKQKSVQNMMNTYDFTASGIHGTLKYIFEILKKNPYDSNYLGIVPYYYIKAKEYYTNLEKVKEINSKANIENYKPKEITFKLNERVREPIKRKKFSILEEE